MSTNSGLLTTHSKAFKDGFHVTVVKAAIDRSLVTASSSLVNNKNATTIQKLDAGPPVSTLASSSTQPLPVHKPSDDPYPPCSTVISRGMKSGMKSGMNSGMKTTRTRPVRPSLSDQLAAIGAELVAQGRQIAVAAHASEGFRLSPAS